MFVCPDSCLFLPKKLAAVACAAVSTPLTWPMHAYNDRMKPSTKDWKRESISRRLKHATAFEAPGPRKHAQSGFTGREVRVLASNYIPVYTQAGHALVHVPRQTHVKRQILDVCQAEFTR